MQNKHKKTLESILKNPVPANIKWRDIETMLVSLGAEIEERAGSRVVIKLNGEAQVFHRPHPKPDTTKGAVTALRIFLRNAGIK